MTDEQFRQLCNVYGFAPSRALRELIDCAVGQAAAELRRLHDLAMEQQGKIYALEMARSMEQKTAKLKRDALLEALKQIEPILARMYGPQAAELPPMQIVRAAIKAAEENT